MTPADEGIAAAKLDDILRDAERKPPMILEIGPTDLIEIDRFKYVAEASSLGLAVGEWPDVIVCDLPGSPWRSYVYRDSVFSQTHEELLWKNYEAKSGFVIRVTND